MKNILASTALATAMTAFASAPDTAPVAAPAALKADKIAPIIGGIAAISLTRPGGGARGSKSLYPFDDLEIGKAFAVMNKDARSMSSIVSNQNRKHRTPVLNADGTPQYHTNEASDGNGGTIQVPDTSKPKTTQTKKFFAVDVDAEITKQIKDTPLKGAKALVYREA